jgi:hypothetical protein
MPVLCRASGQIESTVELSDDERKFLGQYVNAAYLSEKNAHNIRAKFEEDSCVLLHDFLKKDIADALRKACTGADAAFKGGRGVPNYDYHAGEGGGWRGVGPTHKQRLTDTSNPKLLSDWKLPEIQQSGMD